jgi:hypothetical protein
MEIWCNVSSDGLKSNRFLLFSSRPCLFWGVWLHVRCVRGSHLLSARISGRGSTVAMKVGTRFRPDREVMVMPIAV